MFSSAFVVLALSVSTLANVFITSPVASTTFVGGQQATVSWQDDGSAPTLQSFGPAMVSIYAGNAQQQTLLQTISPNIDVSQLSTIQFTPDPSIGPDGDQYFVRFQSLSLKDATNPQYPALAFSAKFTMSGMSGQFNATVQSEIDGQSTAPIGGTASITSAAAATVAVTTVTKSSSSSSSAATSKASTAAGASGSNGAGKLAGAGVAAFAGVAVAVLSGVFC
jgi:hypothetical protein